MVSTYVPDRGDVVWLDFNPQVGHEQAGVRPALVVSPKSYNASSGLMLACPIISKVKQYPFEVRIQSGSIDGAILADQVKSLDWRTRSVKYAQSADEDVLKMTQRLVASLVNGIAA